MKSLFDLFDNLLSPPTRLHKYPALTIPMIKTKIEKRKKKALEYIIKKKEEERHTLKGCNLEKV